MVLTTFVSDIDWMINKIPSITTVPVHFIHDGYLSAEDQEKLNQYPDITDYPILKARQHNGCQHAKIILILYEGGLRFILSTGNLTPLDYEFKTIGFFSKDFKPKENNLAMNEIGTHFYNTLHDDFDYSPVDGWLLLSVPGNYDLNNTKYGLKQVEDILKNKLHLYPELSASKIRLDVCTSGVGNISAYNKSFFSRHLTLNQYADLRIYWPTEEFIKNSDIQYNGANEIIMQYNYYKNALPYLYHYKPKIPRHLTQPHIKTYVIYKNGYPLYGILSSSNFIYPTDKETGYKLGAHPKNFNYSNLANPNSYYDELIWPVTPSNGKYSFGYEHNGIDISAYFGTPIYALGNGKLIYSEWGHTVNKGCDETAYSVTMELDNPVIINGKKVKKIFITHMSGIVYYCPMGNCNKTVKKGELLGFIGHASGTAAEIGTWAPHLHMSLYDNEYSAGLTTNEIEKIYNISSGNEIVAGG